jgi:NAD+ kinase
MMLSNKYISGSNGLTATTGGKVESMGEPLRYIALLYHPKIPESQTLAAEMLEYLEGRKIWTWIGSGWDKAGVTARIADLDLLVTLGGDGSILRAARMGCRHGVPVLGVNMGRLGFLAEVEPHEWAEKLERVIADDYWIEERMMLHAESWRGGEMIETSFEALNEVVISRGALARAVRLSTYIDGGFLTTYVADGVIVATPTGSTAYALAAGGPILPPELKNILLIPIAPHLSMQRAIVLSQGATVRTEVATDHAVQLTVDGQFDVPLRDGDRVVVRASPYTSRFVRTQERNYFYRTLMERLCSP